MAVSKILLYGFVVLAITYQITAESGAADNEVAPEHQSRLLFPWLPRLISCNYTATPGKTCPSCQQALLCLPNNVGLLTTCSFLTPYCNNGWCSTIQGAACNNTSS